MKTFNPRLYFITDSTGFTEKEFLSKIEQAMEGGITLIQLREKNKTTAEYIKLAEKVHHLTKEYGVPLIIDDRVDIAAAIGAEGVHLGTDDMPIGTARRILGKDYIIGATAKTVERATEAAAQGADYLGVGAIFPTTTKVKTVITPVGVLTEICSAVSVPVCAIGGLNKDNINVLTGIPISGICVVSAIMKSHNPKNSAQKLSERMKEIRGF